MLPGLAVARRRTSPSAENDDDDGEGDGITKGCFGRMTSRVRCPLAGGVGGGKRRSRRASSSGSDTGILHAMRGTGAGAGRSSRSNSLAFDDGLFGQQQQLQDGAIDDGCCGLRGPNYGPSLDEQGPALAAVLSYLSDVNAELAARSSAVNTALTMLEAKRQRITARQQQRLAGGGVPSSQQQQGQSRQLSLLKGSGYGASGSSGSGPDSPSFARFGEPGLRQFSSSSQPASGAAAAGGGGSPLLSPRSISRHDSTGKRTSSAEGPTSASVFASLLEASNGSVNSSGGLDADSTVAEEEALAEAMRHVGFGHPGYEVSLYLCTIPSAVGAPRLCLLLLPRDAPPNPDGSWPFYLPYGARVLMPPQHQLLLTSPSSPGKHPSGGVASPALRSPGLKGMAASSSGGTPAKGILRGVHSPPGHGLAHTPRRGSFNETAGAASTSAARVMFAADVGEETLYRRSSGKGLSASAGGGSSGSSRGLFCGPLTSLLSPLKLLVPRLLNTHAVSHDFMGPTAVLALLVIADAVLTALAIAAFLRLVPEAAFIVLAVPPLAIVLSPLAGFWGLVRGTASTARMHASWTTLSLVPATAALILSGLHLQQLDAAAGVAVPLLLVGVKYAALPVLSARIALLDLRADWNRWAKRANNGAVLGFVKDTFAATGSTSASPPVGRGEAAASADAHDIDVAANDGLGPSFY